MDARLQEMLDHYEIRKTLSEYCHACDRADADLMGSTYTGDDSFDDHGLTQAPGPEFAEVMTRRIADRTESIWHGLGQSLVKVEGDTAVAETFFLGVMRMLPDEAKGPRINQLFGRFVDRLERIDGIWKIKHRTCLRDTSITVAVEQDDYAAFGFKAGTRDSNDLGVASLGIAHRT